MEVLQQGEDPANYLKINGVKIKPGTVIKSLTGGGGGYGNAFERDPELVRQDVIDGYVTPAHAQSAYGVELTADLEVDMERTNALRQNSAS